MQRTAHEAPLAENQAAYFDNVFDATGTNSRHDVRVTDTAEVVSDLEALGFVDVVAEVGGFHVGTIVSYPDQWVVVTARRPHAP